MVATYTYLDLSFDKDVLIALAGVACQVQTMRQGKYLCGLWEDSLLCDLLWTKSSNGPDSRMRDLPNTPS